MGREQYSSSPLIRWSLLFTQRKQSLRFQTNHFFFAFLLRVGSFFVWSIGPPVLLKMMFSIHDYWPSFAVRFCLRSHSYSSGLS